MKELKHCFKCECHIPSLFCLNIKVFNFSFHVPLYSYAGECNIKWVIIPFLQVFDDSPAADNTQGINYVSIQRLSELGGLPGKTSISRNEDSVQLCGSISISNSMNLLLSICWGQFFKEFGKWIFFSPSVELDFSINFHRLTSFRQKIKRWSCFSSFHGLQAMPIWSQVLERTP